MPRQLYAFGSNGEGQLGLPAAEIVSTSTRVSSWTAVSPVEAIKGGDNHTLILTGSPGTVFAAGDNRKGQLHNPSSSTRSEKFEKILDNIAFCAATCESSAYLIKSPETSGHDTVFSLITRGAEKWGELCLESTRLEGVKPVAAQRLLPFESPVVDFAAGVWHYVAVLENGDIYGWGKARLGQLGETLSPQGSVTEPTKIEEDILFKPVKAVCGKDFTYLISHPSEGKHMLLGREKFGIRSNMPDRVKGWKDIGATWHAIFVLFEDGTLIAWGKDNMWKPIPPNLPVINKIAVGSDHVLATTREGKLISWGWGKHGNCGDILRMKLVNDMVSGVWNEIDIPGEIETIGAGFCTSFVLSNVADTE